MVIMKSEYSGGCQDLGHIGFKSSGTTTFNQPISLSRFNLTLCPPFQYEQDEARHCCPPRRLCRCICPLSAGCPIGYSAPRDQGACRISIKSCSLSAATLLPSAAAVSRAAVDSYIKYVGIYDSTSRTGAAISTGDATRNLFSREMA